MAKITVVSAYYNREKYVDRTLASIINQTFHDYEFVVIDDGSTDGTLGQLRKYEAAAIKIITHNNMGFTASMIDAIADTNSQYIAIIGSGDEAMPDRLAVQAAYLDSHPDVVAVGSETIQVGVDGYESRGYKFDAAADPYQTLFKRSIFGHSEVMFRRSAYIKVGGYRKTFKYSQDNDLWLRMGEIGKLAQIPQVLHRIYKLSDGVTVVPKSLIQSKAYRQLAVFCARERLAGRSDPVDAFGDAAFTLVPPSKELGKRYLKDGMKFLVRDQRESARECFQAARTQGCVVSAVTLDLFSRVPLVFALSAWMRAVKRALKGNFGGIAV